PAGPPAGTLFRTGGALQSVTVSAIDNTSVTNIAGALGLTTGSAGVGLGIVVEVILKDVRAYIGHSARVFAAAAVSIQATSTERILAIAASAGASPSGGVAGSIIVAVVLTGTRAYVESSTGSASTVHAGGNMTIAASDSADKLELYAGGLAFGSSGGVGASIVVLVRTPVVRAFI